MCFPGMPRQLIPEILAVSLEGEKVQGRQEETLQKMHTRGVQGSRGRKPRRPIGRRRQPPTRSNPPLLLHLISRSNHQASGREGAIQRCFLVPH